MDDLVLHSEPLGMRRDGFPGEVGVVDIRHLVHGEEFELSGVEVEELPPAVPLHPGIAMLARGAVAVAGNIGALRAGIGDDALEPVAVRHQAVPCGPGDLGRGQRLGGQDHVALHADRDAEVFEDLPMRLAAGEFVVGDHFLAARLEHPDSRIPIGTVGGDAKLQDGIALARVEPVLFHEGARPPRREFFLLIAVALAIGVDHRIHPLQHVFGAHGRCSRRAPQACRVS